MLGLAVEALTVFRLMVFSIYIFPNFNVGPNYITYIGKIEILSNSGLSKIHYCMQ